MKLPFYIFAAVSALSIFSCQSTNPTSEPEIAENQTTEAIAETALPIEESAEDESAAAAYIKRTDGVTLTVISEPAETATARAFSSPYIVRAEKDGKALSGFAVSAYFFGTEIPLKTDSEGNAEFLPSTPVRSALNIVQFFPTALEGDMKKDFDLFMACLDKSVKAPYRVHTSALSKGGIILILDLEKDGKNFDERFPTGTELQKKMRQLGFTGIGNGPDFSSEILSGNETAVLEAARGFLGRNYAGFLLFGTIKPAKTAGGADSVILEYSVSAKCVDMKSGKTISTADFTAEGRGKTESSARQDAREKIAAEITLSVYYNL